VLDVQLARRSGIYVLREIRSARRATPSIVVSDAPSDEQAALAAGAAVFLVRPFGVSCFNAVLRDLNDSQARPWWTPRTGPSRKG
jgi:DNA-binding response OmpR family regulator